MGSGVGAEITALGHYQPPRVMLNSELAESIDTTDAWIQDRVGVRARRIAGNETVADMAFATAAKACAASNSRPVDVDLVIVATTAPGANVVAAEVALRLGCNKAVAYDINTACSGFCQYGSVTRI